MRIYLKVKSNRELIPFEHQALLTGTVHKWLGWNEEHGDVSLYSFSRLEGGKKEKNGLQFQNGSSFFFSSYDDNLIKNLIRGIQDDPEMFHGLKVAEVIIQENPDFTTQELFYTASPIFIKRRTGEKIEHILFNDSRANQYLKETLATKMAKAGITDETLEISFEQNYPKAGTKLITYNNIKNRTNWCPVNIKGKPETKLFAWNVGLGNSTGIGFGAIR
jgi:CRISPR-associated endoribonuclease Cas6